MTELTQQRVRIWFCKGEPVKYISHLDLLRVWERILRRAGLPLAYSQGFNPHPRIVIAMPLLVGGTGRNEAVDVILTRVLDVELVGRSLETVLPDGISVNAVESIDYDAPALPSCIKYAVYRITCQDLSLEEAEHRVSEAMSRQMLEVHFRRKTFDLRPLIGALWAEEDVQGVALVAKLLRDQRGRIGRPDVLLEAMGLSDRLVSIDRTRIFFDLEE